MNKFKVLGMMLAISCPVSADEVEDYCNLTRAQAQARSAALAWPSLFASAGNPFLVPNITIVGALNQSVSGFVRGLVTNDVAYYQCRFYGANKSLRDTVSNLDNRIFIMQADAQKPVLLQALKLAEENISLEKKMFNIQNSTVTDLAEAQASRDAIQSQLLVLEQKYSAVREIPPVETNLSLREQATQSQNYQARANSLMSSLDSLAAWDIIGTGGAQYDTQTGSIGAFWSININYSFGQIPSALSSSSVDRLTRKYMEGQYDSPQNVYLRSIRTQNEVLVAEANNKKFIVDRLNTIQELLQKARSVDSVRAQRAQRNLAIQELTQKAALAASTIKIQELEKWLSANTETSPETQAN